MQFNTTGYIQSIHYTRDLRTTAQNTILDTLRIVIASLIKPFSVTQWLYYPCTCLSPQWDLQRLIYIQYKFYTNNLSHTKFKLFFLESSCDWDNTKLCNFLSSWGQCIRVEARHFEWLSSTQFVYPYWRQRQSRYKKSTRYINLTPSTTDRQPTETISVKEGRYFGQATRTDKGWQAEAKFEMCNLVSKSLGQRSPLRTSFIATAVILQCTTQ